MGQTQWSSAIFGGKMDKKADLRLVTFRFGSVNAKIWFSGPALQYDGKIQEVLQGLRLWRTPESNNT